MHRVCSYLLLIQPNAYKKSPLISEDFPQFFLNFPLMVLHRICSSARRLYAYPLHWQRDACHRKLTLTLSDHSNLSFRVLKEKMGVIDVYLLPASSPCRAVLMTAQHIGVKVNKKNVDYVAGEHMKPQYLKMNPQHCMPTIDDEGFYLWESRAIQTYLVNKYAPNNPIYPKDPHARAIVDRMLYFDIGTLYQTEGEYLFPQLFEGQPADPEKEEAFKKALKLLEGFLSKTPYVAGDHLTLADFSVLASLTYAELVDYSFAPYPKISAWLEKMKSEVPNYKEINDDPLKEFKEFLKPSE